MAGGLDSGTAAVIGAAVGAVVSIAVTTVDRILEAVHNRRERKRASRREIREALTELHRALALAGYSAAPDAFAAAAANDLALARLGLILPTAEQPIAEAASLASITAMERGSGVDVAIGAFRRVSGAWFRGELTASAALAEYERRVNAAAAEDVTPASPRSGAR